jgi:hypothetical protein
MPVCRKVAVSASFGGRSHWKRLLIFSRLLPIGIRRLYYIHQSLFTNNDKFGYVVSQIYAQVEMSVNLIVTSAPVIRVFLRAAKSGSYLAPTGSSLSGQYQSFGGSLFQSASRATYGLKRSKTRFSGANNLPGSDIELPFRSQVETVSKVVGGNDGQSSISDDSQRGIVVRHTVEVDHIAVEEALQ